MNFTWIELLIKFYPHARTKKKQSKQVSFNRQINQVKNWINPFSMMEYFSVTNYPDIPSK